MAFDYDTLIAPKATPGSIRNTVNYDLVDPVQILRKALAKVAGTVRCREMRAMRQVTVPLGSTAIILPERYLGHDRLLDLATGLSVEKVEPDRLAQTMRIASGALAAGDPFFFAIANETAILDCITATERTMLWFFWQSPAPLGPTNQTNWITERYPDLLDSACQYEVALFRKDAEAQQYWAADFTAKVQTVNAEASSDEDKTAVLRAFQDTVDWGRVPSLSILRDSESYVYGVLRANEMKQMLSFAVGVGDTEVELPASFREPILFTDGLGCEMGYYTESAFLRGIRQYDGLGNIVSERVRNCAIVGNRVLLDTASDSATVINLACYCAPAPLGPANPANFLTTRYVDLLRTACRAFALKAMGESQAYVAEKAILDEMLSRANAEQDLILRGSRTPRT